MSEEHERLRYACDLATQMLEKAPDPDALCLAVGLLIGARGNLRVLEEWEAWGQLVSQLLLLLAPRAPVPREDMP